MHFDCVIPHKCNIASDPACKSRVVASFSQLFLEFTIGIRLKPNVLCIGSSCGGGNTENRDILRKKRNLLTFGTSVEIFVIWL